LLRIFFILLILAGGALGVAYPWAASNLSGTEIVKLRLYERSAGFIPAEVLLVPSQAPVLPTVELATRGPLARGDRDPVLTVTVDAGGRTVLAQTLDFEDVEPRAVNPQAGEHLYRASLPKIEPVEGERYLFTIGPGISGEEQLLTADLVLDAGAFGIDPRAIPAGYVLMALGLIGFIASFRRRRPANPNSSPPPPRWGRG
jgi:hypothetical protein